MATRELRGNRDWTQDEWTNHALREIFNTYGDVVSTVTKAKSLSKFGITRNSDSGVKTTIADFQGAVVNETFETTNAIDYIISTSANDTGIITLEGNTIDADGNLAFVVQDATLTGQTRAALATPLARCTRMTVKDGTFASPSVDLQGIVSAYVGTGGQSGAGVPSVDAAVKNRIRGDLGRNQTDKCATTVSSTDYWLIRELHCGLEQSAGATVNADFDLEVRRLGGVWKPVGVQVNMRTSTNPFENVQLVPYVIAPPNSEVRMVIVSDGTNVQAEARIEGILAEIKPQDYNLK